MIVENHKKNPSQVSRHRDLLNASLVHYHEATSLGFNCLFSYFQILLLQYFVLHVFIIVGERNLNEERSVIVGWQKV